MGFNEYKNLITGKTLKKAKGALNKAEGALDKASTRLTDPANGSKNLSNQGAHMQRISDIADKAKAKADSTSSATKNARVATGVGAASLAGATGAGYAAGSKKQKTASDIIEDQFEKIARDRDDDTETRMWRDRIAPEFGRGFKTFGAMLPVGIAMMAHSHSKGNMGQLSAKQLGVLGIGSAGANAAFRAHDTNKLHEKYIGGKAGKEEHLKTQLGGAANYAASGLSQHAPGMGLVGLAASLGTTPEAVIQKKRRRALAEKEASTVVSDTFEKIAQATITLNEEIERGLKSPVPKAEITKKEEAARSVTSPIAKATITKKEEEHHGLNHKLGKAESVRKEEAEKGLDHKLSKATIVKNEEAERGKKNNLTHGAGVISTKKALAKTAMDIVNDIIEKK